MARGYRQIYCISFFLMILLFTSGFLWCDGRGPNLLTNNGFEKGDTAGWGRDLWNKGGAIEVVTDYVHQGRYALKISSPDIENDIRLTQRVNVEPDTYYSLSGWIAARDIQENRVGANICIMSGFDYAGNVSGTADWKHFELNFKTSKAHTIIKIAARLGMYYNTVKGSAYFDDLALEKLNYVPSYSVVLKAPEGTQTEKKEEKKEQPKTQKRKMKKKDPVFGNMNLCLILTLILIGLGLVGLNVFITIRREKKNDTNQ